MIRVKTNIGNIVTVSIKLLHSLADNDKMLRTTASSVLDLMKKRIHKDGLDADNTPIGTYSKGYMIIRTGSFQNAARVSRGKNIGKLKDAGVFTDRTIRLNKNVAVFTGEEKVGTKRPTYKRGNDTKVILSLTKAMENDIKVIPIKSGSYGIGYASKENYDKSQWCEATYKRKGKIFALSQQEQEAVQEVAEKFVKDALS